VKVGDPVFSSTHIGEMGNTKGNVTITTHLHFELRTAMNVDLNQDFPLRGKLFWINQDGGESCSPWTDCWLDLGLLYGYDASYKAYEGK
jgi:murein DD-endopeptidase MepM/ murein hydrolase activator NlpD